MSKYTPVLFIFLVLQVSCATDLNTATVSHSINTLFGIRLGQPLKSQFSECPKSANGEYEFGFHKSTTPCWQEPRATFADVMLPLSVINETKAHIDSTARLRLENDMVVEIELKAEPTSLKNLKDYMMTYYGKPQKIETYERDSRVDGLSENHIFVWQANGNKLLFFDRASDYNILIRAYNEAWADREAQRDKTNQ